MKLWSKFRSLIRARKLDADMAEEMRLHVELQTEQNIARGMSVDDARNAARRLFGGVEQIKEIARDQRGVRWLSDLIQDVRFAGRQLRNFPGFTFVAVLSLACGIGVTTAVFSVVNNRLVERVPLRNPDEVVLFQFMPGPLGEVPRRYDGNLGSDIDPASGQLTKLNFSRRVFDSFRAEREILADVCAVAGLWGSTVRTGNESEVVISGQLVSGNYYQVLGVPAAIGRTISLADDEPGAPPVCVISDHYWRKRFGGDPASIGSTIQVNRVAATIIGVTPPNFHGTMQVRQETDITMPLASGIRVRRDGEAISKPGFWWLRLIGRLKPGVSREQARSRLEPILQQNVREDSSSPGSRDMPRLLGVEGDRTSTSIERRGEFRLLVPMLGMAALLLLAGCANIANLLLARGAARGREIAVRLALGATRGRIVRQLLTESMLIALLGAVAGSFVARWNLALVATLLPDASSGYSSFLQLGRLPVDWRIIAFLATLGLITGVAFGLVPTLRATRLDLSDELHGASLKRRGNPLGRFGQSLVILQIAVSFVLLICAGLFVRTLNKVGAIDLGFQSEHRLMFILDAQSTGYLGDQASHLYEHVAEQIGAVPGVRAVSYSGWPVLTGEGGPYSGKMTLSASSERGGSVLWNQVGPNFFEAYGIPILRGRRFGSQDQAKGPPVAIVNQALVGKYFADGSPIGHRIHLDVEREIVGVVRDAKLTVADMKDGATPTVFIPFEQSSQGYARFVVWTADDTGIQIESIRKAVGKVDPNVPLAGVSTQAEHVKWRLLNQRLFARLAGYVGLLAMGFVGAGLYGLMAHAVSRRRNEIGLRMALGALPQAVVWMVLRDSLSIVGIGLAAGIGAAVATTRLLKSMLYDLSPTDPTTFAIVALLLTTIAFLATWLPARRAAKVDPIVALRCE